MGFVSDDLVNFKSLGRVAEVLPEAKEWTGGSDIWAPDIVKVGDEYRLYCSNSTWGVQQSCIFLAVSDKAEGPYMIYNKETDYYYLFVSYGSLKTDYNIREKRFNQDPGPSQMQIRQIFWNEEGWPVVSAYTMEETGGSLDLVLQDTFTMKAVAGRYQRITFAKAYPQGISTAVPMIPTDIPC